ncbi:MAG: hypothetical protein IPP00_03550 [Actinomycetales bacterium]|uniref:Guanylate kinase-like domain-containing protein n=1 Tax=Candidatus Phosphoribacter hodrii TaxID=2953743 RepID=A0A9D7T7X2_9MICO|nr:hypothetical protein [Candidatus Phosphoribacter hodrii]
MTADIALVLGASASGKSRLIRRVLEIAHAGGVLRDVRCAQRFTTRATRVAESLPGENEFLESEEFRRRVSCGEIDIDWSRQVTADRANWYGFSLGPQLDLPGLVLLSANNYLDWEANPLLSELRVEGRLVVVRVYAARETREARLRERRPLSPTTSSTRGFRTSRVSCSQVPTISSPMTRNSSTVRLGSS